MARWDDILTENSRLLLDARQARIPQDLPLDPDHTTTDDEGHDTQIRLHRRWHFPRALRWWTHRGENMRLAT